MAEILVGKESEMKDGDIKIVEAEGFEIGVYRHGGKFFAYRNLCTHQGGPVCEGVVKARVVDVIGADRTYQGSRFNEDEPLIVCPWHGYEFRLKTGENPINASLKLKTHEIIQRNGDIYVVA